MNFLKFPQAKYIGVFSFGYFSHLVWHEHKPRTFLKNLFDKFAVPIVFSHVGGSFHLYEINGSVIGYAIGIFVLGEAVRFLAMSCISFL